MAVPLKHFYGPEVPQTIAGMIKAVERSFDVEAFVDEVLEDYTELELMARGRRIAEVLRAHLPADYPTALAILLDSAEVEIAQPEHAMASFIYMPHLRFVERYGLDHFEASMAAQYQLTPRFTAEFSIRPFIERYPEATLKLLKTWTQDPNEHVRRLVSEGTRPRLPWASRLRDFQKNPAPVLDLLELLKDDASEYVRRSVANNLNDIGKDHPSHLLDTARRWLRRAPLPRQRLIRHALRSEIKKGDTKVLGLLGYGAEPKVKIQNASLTPKRLSEGEAVKLSFDLVSTATQPQRIMVDFVVHFVKANGSTNAKTFKLKAIELGPKASHSFQKTIAFKPVTTRKHYPGTHAVDLLLNGRVHRIGEVELTP